jgi:hypothetical protein
MSGKGCSLLFPLHIFCDNHKLYFTKTGLLITLIIKKLKTESAIYQGEDMLAAHIYYAFHYPQYGKTIM